jgi:hypothetical protein
LTRTTSVLSLAYTQAGLAGTANQHTTQINDGLTLTINGTGGPVSTALYVGSNTDNLAVNNQTTVRFVNAGGTPASSASGGTLRIDNALADLQVRQTSSSTAGGSRQATLDLSGLSNFNANLRNFEVGAGDPTNTVYNRAIGSMTLAYNNTIKRQPDRSWRQPEQRHDVRHGIALVPRAEQRHQHQLGPDRRAHHGQQRGRVYGGHHGRDGADPWCGRRGAGGLPRRGAARRRQLRDEQYGQRRRF